VYGAVPPVAEAVNVIVLPINCVPENVKSTTRGWGATLTVDELEACTLLASLTVKLSG